MGLTWVLSPQMDPMNLTIRVILKCCLQMWAILSQPQCINISPSGYSSVIYADVSVYTSTPYIQKLRADYCNILPDAYIALTTITTATRKTHVFLITRNAYLQLGPDLQWISIHTFQFNLLLTHWGRDKMAAIFLMTFSNAFSWMKIYEFWLGFHLSLFLRASLTIFNHWFK